MQVPIGGDGKTNLKVFGTDFFWPCPSGNPYFDLIPEETDIVITHGPAMGFVDGNGGGCPSLLKRIKEIRPRLVVCGHIHSAHGVIEGTGDLEGVTFVNAAICLDGYKVGWEPIVIDL